MNPYEHFYKHQNILELLDKFKIKPWHWIVLLVLVGMADFLSGNNIQFPILYILPVALAGWSGRNTTGRPRLGPTSP